MQSETSQRLTCQKHLFSFPEGVHYLNCATRSPASRQVEEAGHEALRRTANPFGLKPEAFFSDAERVRALFSRLINNPDPERIAVIPAVSYGMATVARNLPYKPGLRQGQKVILIDDEFPSDVFIWQRVSRELNLRIETISKPDGFPSANVWNERLLSAIDADTALVMVPPVHWMYGTRFDLKAISERCRDVGAWLVIDGTQSVGALPFDLEEIRPDALICAGYKWLMGPYSLGLAYFGDVFDEGAPLEESWMNRLKSNEFHRLTDYEAAYRPKAYRYNVGEHSHFIQMPMLEAALTQLLDWQPERIQDYCRDLMADALPRLEELGCRIEKPEGRAHHLLGLWLPEHMDPLAVQQQLQSRNVSVSPRGRALRVSPHVYNDADDVQALVEALALL